MTFSIHPTARETIIAHARSEYPKEACGLIIAGAYRPCFNYAVDPTQDFLISTQEMARALATGKLEAVVHSHPDGPIFPSERDMRGQMDTAVPWVIVPIDKEDVLPFTIWGDQLPTAPVLGRTFLHGIHDCYSLVRDVFRLGREELAKEDVDWPFPPQDLPNVPRNDGWWQKKPDQEPQDLYADYIAKAGFRQIDRSEVRAGDGFLCKIRSEKLNHAGVIVGGGMILHHFPARLSRREPAGLWQRAAEMWVRYVPTETLDA